ncbi:hypothetical protein BsWGS_25472 [Bradybaena similaris]
MVNECVVSIAYSPAVLNLLQFGSIYSVSTFEPTFPPPRSHLFSAPPYISLMFSAPPYISLMFSAPPYTSLMFSAPPYTSLICFQHHYTTASFMCTPPTFIIRIHLSDTYQHKPHSFALLLPTQAFSISSRIYISLSLILHI